MSRWLLMSAFLVLVSMGASITYRKTLMSNCGMRYRLDGSNQLMLSYFGPSSVNPVSVRNCTFIVYVAKEGGSLKFKPNKSWGQVYQYLIYGSRIAVYRSESSDESTHDWIKSIDWSGNGDFESSSTDPIKKLLFGFWTLPHSTINYGLVFSIKNEEVSVPVRWGLIVGLPVAFVLSVVVVGIFVFFFRRARLRSGYTRS